MRRILATVTALSLLGCTTPTIATTVPPDLELGRLGERTAFELGPASTPPPTPGPPPTPAPPGPPPAGDVGRDAAPDPAGPPPSPPPDGAGADTAEAIPTEPATAAQQQQQQQQQAAPSGPNAPDAPLQDPGEPDKRQRARTGLFWTGIVFTAIGGAGTIAFAAAGEGIEDQLSRGYEDSSLTRARRSQLEDRGAIMNGLAIGSAALTLVGIAFASIAYGVDYTRCGKLAKRRRKPCRDER